ncbi:unnamed protein product [Ambrosiozyma monospora]|uniref:Unnamed protein product n=1 Tax=Ambrosiozyma monospora TaxID=43982 RepID=A0ACB5SWK6_AMBMO|nr:unnamed protein product [Ambrosiozyma monospora]
MIMVSQPHKRIKLVSNTIPAKVLEITTTLPLELQCLVLKHLILSRIKNMDSDVSLCQIVHFIGYNPTLDGILALVL